MKKCLHLKKTERHWKRKAPKVITWRERKEAERQRQLSRMRSHVSNPNQLFAAVMGEPPRRHQDIDVLAAVLGLR